MLERIRRTITDHALAKEHEPLWVAVSAGVDSMVLLHALRRIGHPCHVAHVDHGLRGAESDADREFVRTYCEEHHIPFTAQQVDVRSRAEGSGESVQMAARVLRLEWLKALARNGPVRVATAHHADDVIETFFLGLIQGMGANGWGSIPVASDVFIRPLIDVSRAEILAYAKEHGVPWREDASNAESKYLRNRVRNELLPLLESWRPGTRRNLSRNMRLFGELDALSSKAGAQVLRTLRPEPDGSLRVPFERILGDAPLVVLYHVVHGMGFHPDRLEDMLDAITHNRTGARFPAAEHEVFIDRAHLVIARLSGPQHSWIIPSPDANGPAMPLHIMSVFADAIEPASDRATAWLDADRVLFPLELRPWRRGDRMRPDGLGGSKLISDILIDAKVPRDRKDRVYVLADAERIIWLCGMRLSEDVKASKASTRVIKCTWSGS